MHLTSDEKQFVDQATAFVENVIRPQAKQIEDGSGVSRELISQMGKLGFLGVSLPKEYGGLNHNPLTYGFFTEAIGKGCAATRSLITVHSSLVSHTILRYGSALQKKTLLPQLACGNIIAAFALSEPNHGSDAKSIETSYETTADGFILNGRKKWITMGGIADLYMVMAKKGAMVSAFLVDRKLPGISVKPIVDTMAGRGTHLAEIIFDNVSIPKDALLLQEGSGFSYIVNYALDHGRYSIAWGGVAIAHEALDAMVSYARSREQFGKKLFNFQLIQGMIGDSSTKYSAARALCIEAGMMRNQNHSEATLKTTTAKYFASKVANEIASFALQVHGANGFHPDYVAEKLFREAKVLEIIEGTSQIQQQMISDAALRDHYKEYHAYKNESS
ncbi:MAG: acyl-CoA dehydrogenase family protein [Chlamydiales bacterium]|nr:acyl-CoA dehydrogenase family protein [Chlamydiales bacterium]